jgi:hypothetical protein
VNGRSLEETADAAEQQLQLGALVMIDSACAFASVALAALRDLKPAAVLIGAPRKQGKLGGVRGGGSTS